MLGLIEHTMVIGVVVGIQVVADMEESKYELEAHCTRDCCGVLSRSTGRLQREKRYERIALRAQPSNPNHRVNCMKERTIQRISKINM